MRRLRLVGSWMRLRALWKMVSTTVSPSTLSISLGSVRLYQLATRPYLSHAAPRVRKNSTLVANGEGLTNTPFGAYAAEWSRRRDKSQNDREDQKQDSGSPDFLLGL